MSRLSDRQMRSFVPRVECVEQRCLLSASLLSALSHLNLSGAIPKATDYQQTEHTTLRPPVAAAPDPVLAAPAHPVVGHDELKEPTGAKDGAEDRAEAAAARVIVAAHHAEVGPELRANGEHLIHAETEHRVEKAPVAKEVHRTAEHGSESGPNQERTHASVSRAAVRSLDHGATGHGGTGGGGKGRVAASSGVHGSGGGRGAGHQGHPSAAQVAWQGLEAQPPVTDTPEEAGSDFLAALLPLDPDLLSQAVQHFLAELDGVRLELQNWLATQTDAMVVVLLLAATVSAADVARRCWQKRTATRSAGDAEYLAGLLPEPFLPEGA